MELDAVPSSPPHPEEQGPAPSPPTSPVPMESDALLCGICVSYLEDNLQCPHCTRCFCRVHLAEHLARHGTCPVCAAPLQLGALAADPKRQMEVDRVTGDCDVRGGCGMRVARGNRAAHRLVCPKVPVECEFSCGAWVPRGQLDLHLENCSYRPVLCDCGASVPLYHHEQHLQRDCPVQEDRCALCGDLVLRGNMQAHREAACPLEVVPCALASVGCPHRGPRLDLGAHDAVCSFRALQPVLHGMQAQVGSLQRVVGGLETRLGGLESQLLSLRVDVKRAMDELSANVGRSFRRLAQQQQQPLHAGAGASGSSAGLLSGGGGGGGGGGSIGGGAGLGGPSAFAGSWEDSSRSIMVLGGFDGKADLNSTEILSFATGLWSPGTALPRPRSCLGAGVIETSVFAFGGEMDVCASNVVHQLDLSSLAAGWRTAAGMLVPRKYLAGVSLGNHIYALGGNTSQNFDIRLATCNEFYEAKLDRWVEVASMNLQRYVFAAAAVPEHQAIYVFGGRGPDTQLTKTCERLDVRTGKWEKQPDLPRGRSSGAAAALGTSLFVTGGHDGTGSLNSVDRFDTRTARWDTYGARLSVPRNNHSAVAVGEALYVMGGNSLESRFSCVRHEKGGSTWTMHSAMKTGRSHFQAVVIPEGPFF